VSRTETAQAPDAIDRLTAIPNVGPATAEDLLALGITSVGDLEGRDPDRLFEALCSQDGRRHDPCTRDVFAAAIAYADDGDERPWWHHTRQRKDDDMDDG
jgi:hypothetical protein